jgi:hypothetical protein
MHGVDILMHATASEGSGRLTPVNANQLSAIAPAWLTFEGGSQYSGLSIRTLQNYAAANYIRTSNVIAPGATRGRRLIDRASLDEFLEAGVGAPPAVLVMNRNRRDAS